MSSSGAPEPGRLPDDTDLDSSILPSWLPSSFSGFRNLVIGVISAWLVGIVIGVTESMIEAIQALFDAVRAVGSAGALPFSIVASEGSELISTILIQTEIVIVGLAYNAGPLAPIVIVIMWAAIVVALLLALRSLIGLIIRVIPIT